MPCQSDEQATERLPSGLHLVELRVCTSTSRVFKNGEWRVEQTFKVTAGLDELAKKLTAPDEGKPATRDTVCTAIAYVLPDFTVRDDTGREWRPRVPYTSRPCGVPSRSAIDEIEALTRTGTLVSEKKVERIRTAAQVAGKCDPDIKNPFQLGYSAPEGSKLPTVTGTTVHVCRYRPLPEPPRGPSDGWVGASEFIAGGTAPTRKARSVLDNLTPATGACAGARRAEDQPSDSDVLWLTQGDHIAAVIEVSGCHRVVRGSTWSLMGVTTDVLVSGLLPD